MNINDRITELELIQNRNDQQHEKGAWIIITDLQENEIIVSSARLGKKKFSTRKEVDSFIAVNHRGAPTDVSGSGLIEVKIV